MMKNAAVATVASIFSYMIVLAPRHDTDVTDNLCFAKHVLQCINHIISNSENESSQCQIKAVCRSELVSNTHKNPSHLG